MCENGQHIDNTDQPDYFEQFTGKERKEVQKIWEDSKNAAPAISPVDRNEINKAWQSVNTRIHSKTDSSQRIVSEKIQPWYGRWKWVAAAAVLLLVAGAGFLFTPKTVTAPLGQMAMVTLPDGSAVKLNSGSEIQYNRLFGYTNRDMQINGEAFFVVKKAQQPFTVWANGATVQVTGTKFNVRSWKTEVGTEVAVAEGSVLFSGNGAADHSVTIGPGQSSKLDNAMQQPTTPMDAAVDRITGWRSNSLMFNDKSLTVIFAELERRFDVQIAMEDSAIGRRTLTAYYSDPGSIASVLQDICRVKGLKFAPTSNGYRVYK